MIDYNDRALFNDYGAALDKRNNEQINATGADYRMIIGRRSNGKTYPTMVFDGIKRFLDSNETDCIAYVRRWKDDLPFVAGELFNGCIENGWLKWYSNGKYNDVSYYRRRWYLQFTDENGDVKYRCPKPFCYAFAINVAEKYKGPDYPMIKTIVFDEFCPEKGQGGYCPREWRLYQSILSTIIRERDDVVVYMIANTIGKESCKYFDAYGIDPDTLKQGVLQQFRFRGGGTMAVEWCLDAGSTKVTPSAKYFDISGASCEGMITGGNWEQDKYPQMPRRLADQVSIIMPVYVLTERGKIIQIDIIATPGGSALHIHYKTTPLQYRPGDYVYLPSWDQELIDNPTVRVGFNSQFTLDRLILRLIKTNKAYYSSDPVGEKLKYFLESVKCPVY